MLKGTPRRLKTQVKSNVIEVRRSRYSAGLVKRGNAMPVADTVEIVGRWHLAER